MATRTAEEAREERSLIHRNVSVLTSSGASDQVRRVLRFLEVVPGNESAFYTNHTCLQQGHQDRIWFVGSAGGSCKTGAWYVTAETGWLRFAWRDEVQQKERTYFLIQPFNFYVAQGHGHAKILQMLLPLAEMGQ